MTPTYDDLREQVIYLTERLSMLTGSLGQIELLRTNIGLSPKQAQTLALMLNTNRPLTVMAVYANVYEHENGGGPQPEIVKVAMSQLRLRLSSLGAPEGGIRAAYGTGCYSMSPELRAWLTERLAPAQEIAA